MSNRPFRRAGAMLVAAFAAAACAEHPGSPTTPAVATEQADFQLLHAPTILDVLHRSAPLREDVTATAVIGAAGGEIRLPGAGVTVRFEAGAVAADTEITAIAPAGRLVFYEFQPHGLRFEAPVWVIQDVDRIVLGGPAGRLLGVEAGYFPSRQFLNVAAGRARVTELMRVDRQADGALTFRIRHFSGYVFSTGRRAR